MTKKTRWEACTALDFDYDLEVLVEDTYVGDGRDFDVDPTVFGQQ